MNRIVAVKNYGFEWNTVFDLDERSAGRKLREHGVDWAIAQNLLDPLPGSAVDQSGPRSGYDDRRLRDELRVAGLRVFEATSVFFRPAAYEARPDLRPVDERGRVMEPFGWYVGLCPSDSGYLAERVELMERVVATLAPDGVFLSFIRFPGFWELWMPETRRADIREYCFCERCLGRFQQETGVALPDGREARTRALTTELRTEWTAWKCGLIASVVRALGDAARRQKPGVEVMVNGLGFGRDEYDGAVREVLGQDRRLIAGPGGPAGHLELMFYHQIQRREPTGWIEPVAAEARKEVAGTLLACLQSRADYLDPIYAPGARRRDLPPSEFRDALAAVARSDADGATVYFLRDLLEDELRGRGELVGALRDFKAGRLG